MGFNSMNTILFVDDEQLVLDGLKRMLRSMRNEWEMLFANSGKEALEILEQKKIDVIVSDMRMPGMDGVELLGRVRQQYPRVIRFVLSGHSEAEMLLESVKATHQFLAKPCDADILKSAVNRAISLDSLLHREDLNRVVAGIDALPSLPGLYSQIMQEVSSKTGTLSRVGEIVSKDIGMTAKMLQLVNSAFFGLRAHIESPSQAVNLLGLDIIRGLVLTSKVFSQFDQQRLAIDIDSLFEHSSHVGALAKSIAAAHSLDRKSCDHALMAGMLHDVGKLILASSLSSEFEQSLQISEQQSIPDWQGEMQVFGCTHSEIGSYLLGLWGLPNPILEAVAFHHHPHHSIGADFTPLTAVYIANLISKSDGNIENLLSDDIYIERLGLQGHIPQWLALRDELLQRSE